jgi:phage portal protein BeeE
VPAAVVRADEVRDEVPTHDLARLIRDGVNDNEDWPGFVETLVSTCLLRGNAVASIDTDQRGRCAGIGPRIRPTSRTGQNRSSVRWHDVDGIGVLVSTQDEILVRRKLPLSQVETSHSTSPAISGALLLTQ